MGISHEINGKGQESPHPLEASVENNPMIVSIEKERGY